MSFNKEGGSTHMSNWDSFTWEELLIAARVARASKSEILTAAAETWEKRAEVKLLMEAVEVLFPFQFIVGLDTDV